MTIATLYRVSLPFKYGYTLYSNTNKLKSGQSRLWATCDYTSLKIEVDLDSDNYKSFLPAYYLNPKPVIDFIAVLDPATKEVGLYEVELRCEVVGEKRKWFFRYYYDSDRDEPVPDLYKANTYEVFASNKSDARLGYCTESPSYQWSELDVEEFLQLDYEEQKDAVVEFYYSDIADYLLDPIMEDSDFGDEEECEFICGSEKELVALTKLATTVWHKVLLTPVVVKGFTITYTSSEWIDGNNEFEELVDYHEIGMYFADKWVKDKRERFETLLVVINEYNKFEGSHYSYNDGAEYRRSGYYHERNTVCLHFSVDDFATTSPLVFIDAIEKLKDWLKDKVSQADLEYYLPD